MMDRGFSKVTVDTSRPAVSTMPFSYGDLVSATVPSVVTVFSSRYRSPQQISELPEGLPPNVVLTPPPEEKPPNFDLVPQHAERNDVNEDRNLGSGVIVSAKGYVLTNHHVIAK